MDFRFYWKTLFLFVFICFPGCVSLTGDQEVISMDKFEKIVSGKFDNVKDIIELFPKSIKDVEFRVEKCVKDVEVGIDGILSISAKDRNFDNTIRALDSVEAKFTIGSNPIGAFEMISTDEEIRKFCHESYIKLRQFAVEAFSNKKIYEAVKEYLDGNFKNEKLTEEESYFLKELVKDFKRQGFDLPDKEFLEIKELKKDISKLSSEFEQNVNTDKSFMTASKEDLNGLKDDFISSLEQRDGKVVLKCDYPTRSEILSNCRSGDIRKRYFQMFMNRAYPKNIDILNEVIAKRDKLAKKLNFKSFASLSLDSQMVKNPETAYSFLDNLSEKTIQKMEKEFKILTQDLPDGIELDRDGNINLWDYYFVESEYKKKHYNIDERKIAKYFPVDKTLTKVFEIYQNFLGLDFKEIKVDGLWHKDVKVVEIYNKEDDKYIGTLFLDLYPRENKYPHACMIDLVPTICGKDFKSGKKLDVPGVVMVIANFPKATKEKPALLKHGDVVTFFHEFGHAMHGFLGKTELFSNSGTSVKRDFVEMPSQVFEEWMWDKDILKMISSHYKTGESLPEDVIDKKIELKKLTSGFFVTRQCWLSLLALDYFSPGEVKDTGEIKENLHNKYMKNIAFDPNTHFQASFSHLMGYGAKYYGYMWAKVFSLDLFYNVKKEGLLNQKAGEKLKNMVLGKGGSVDPDILLENYLGRKPSQKAFLNDLGIS